MATASSQAGLRLYRQLLCMKRSFPFDPERAKAQLDMPYLLHQRVRSAFEASRGEVDPLKVEALFSTARSELEALQTMCNNTFFKTFPGKGIGASASSPLGDLTQKSGSVRFSIFGKFWRS